MRLAFATDHHTRELTPEDRALRTALTRDGHVVEPQVWSATGIPWGDYQAVVIRSCWDYHLHTDSFLDWLEFLDDRAVRVINPLGAIHWNIDKRYLQALAAGGVEIPETRWFDRGDTVDLDALGWNEVVAKPVVGATAYASTRLRAPWTDRARAALEDLSASSAFMVQKFLPEILICGEWSCVFIDGGYSHAVRKFATPGDFRVQSDFGGVTELAYPSPHSVEFARAAL